MNRKDRGTTVVLIVVVLTLLPMILYGITSIILNVKKSSRLSQSQQTRIIVNNLAVELAASSLDVDGDSKIEMPAPGIGNTLPSGLSSRTSDYWKNDLRYCAYDLLGGNIDPGYATSPPHATRIDLAGRLISSGRNGAFETDCNSDRISGDDIGQDMFEYEIVAGVYSSNGWIDAGDYVLLSGASDHVTIGGTSKPPEKLEVVGGLTVGATATDTVGAIKFSGYSLFGFNGLEWKELLHGIIRISADMTLTPFSVDKYHYITGTSNVTITLPDPALMSVGDTMRFKVAPESEMGYYLILDAGDGNEIDGSRRRALWAEEEATLSWTGSKWTKTQGRSRPEKICLYSGFNEMYPKAYNNPRYFTSDCGTSVAFFNNMATVNTGDSAYPHYSRFWTFRESLFNYSVFVRNRHHGSNQFRIYKNGSIVSQHHIASHVNTAVPLGLSAQFSDYFSYGDNILVSVISGGAIADYVYFRGVEVPTW